MRSGRGQGTLQNLAVAGPGRLKAYHLGSLRISTTELSATLPSGLKYLHYDDRWKMEFDFLKRCSQIFKLLDQTTNQRPMKTRLWSCGTGKFKAGAKSMSNFIIMVNKFPRQIILYQKNLGRIGLFQLLLKLKPIQDVDLKIKKRQHHEDRT